MSWSPPTDLTPLKPPANVATVAKLRTGPPYDIYECLETGQPFTAKTGSALTAVVNRASLSRAWLTLKSLTGLTPTSPLPDLQAALNWFTPNIEPLYAPLAPPQ
jgi:hypothetical protein